MSEILWRALLPWQLKLVAKLVLARLPVPYAWWKRAGLFEHGPMHDPAYAEAVFRSHLERSGLEGRKDFVCLELGPGDSLFSAVIAKLHGARQCWLVDSGDFATRDMANYRRLARHLEANGAPPLPAEALGSFEALLTYCGARYLTGGLATLREIPSASVDLIWSQAVIEHIRKRDFAAVLRETRRVLRKDGVASHVVDLRDHLGGALNNLRFGEGLWESEWMARSGFYTNRLRHSELIEEFSDAGFAVETIAIDRWAALPTLRSRLAEPFRGFRDEDLLVSGCSLVLHPV
jgi:SAM-dependent methyltransferase